MRKKPKRRGLGERRWSCLNDKGCVKERATAKTPLTACSIFMFDYMNPNFSLIIFMFIWRLAFLTSVTSACLLRNLSNYLSFSQIFGSLRQQHHLTWQKTNVYSCSEESERWCCQKHKSVQWKFFSLPLCFHQLVRTKLASDTQTDMYTIPFLWLCSSLHPHTFDVPTSIVVWCVINPDEGKIHSSTLSSAGCAKSWAGQEEGWKVPEGHRLL